MPMKSRQLEALLAEKTRKTGSQIDQTFRRLRSASGITSAPRGLNSPDLTPEEAARYLIAVVGSLSPSEAVVTDASLGWGRSATGETLRGAVTALLSDPSHSVVGVRLWLDSRYGEIIHHGGNVETFGPVGGSPPEDEYADAARDCAFIGGGLIQRIAAGLA